MPKNNTDKNERWIPDRERDSCGHCKRKFTFFTRRHHCRSCGEIFCDLCSSTKTTGVQKLTNTPFGKGYHSNSNVRVCDECYQYVKQQADYAPSYQEINNLEYIKRNGILLGKGKFGIAYRYQLKVYKIPLFDRLWSFRENLVGNPSRTARLWNDVYKTLYGGRYRQYAVAKVVLLDEIILLETPYIDGRPADAFESFLFNQRFEASCGKLMGDAEVPGNLKYHRGNVLPVDFDHVYDRRRLSIGSDILVNRYG